jgi:hypothetical protein
VEQTVEVVRNDEDGIVAGSGRPRADTDGRYREGGQNPKEGAQHAIGIAGRRRQRRLVLLATGGSVGRGL